ncbi:hypothetical protein AAG570_003394 [Ranatra chinensis]|uniref:Peptidase M3A/M3B catalytic domain-containing protein n=1 Tax=Ranatra chinensis TaxID=642074 RepID=A0ABD0Y448_9HEMI
MESGRLLEESCSADRSRKLVDVFDELSDTLCRVADLAEFVRLAHPDHEFSNAAEDACISISGIVEKLNTNRELYGSLKKVVSGGDKFPTSDVENHVASLFLFDFEQSGIHLDEEDRKQVVALNDYILQLGQRFMAGAVNGRAIPRQRIPPSIRHLFDSEADSVVVNGLFSDSKDEIAREAAYRVYLLPDAEQEMLLEEMLDSRLKLARLCGFPSYAHSLAGSPSAVKEFMDDLSDRLRPKAERDFQTMLRMKREINPQAKSLAPWDVPHMTNKARHDWLKSHVTEFSKYFSLGSCMDGLNGLMNELFGITFVNTPLEAGEAWAPDIYKLAVTHEAEGLLGYIYCDFYERSNKPNQDCHFTIRGGRTLADGSYQMPVVVLMLNLAPPRWNTPSLLTPGMVDNLFHEVGHAMHSMLARTQHQHVTGTRCTTDFAEVPSILMEYFASDPRILRTFARHFQTQEPMPDHLLDKLCASKNLFAASGMQAQVFYSMLDQEFHGGECVKGVTTQLLESTHNAYYGLPYVQNTAWHLRFSHLVGYGAKYYSYLMSRAVASCIWQKYFREAPLSRTEGERYRKQCLAHGGGKPPRALVSDYLGVEVTPATLANALIDDLQQ